MNFFIDHTLLLKVFSRVFVFLVVQFSRCLFVVCLLSDNSFIIPHFPSFVNPFSEVFLKIFFISFSEIFVCYKLFYYTTFFFVCQALFRTFLKFFLSSSFFTELFSRAVLFSISHFLAFVKTFCDFFLPFFEFAFSELLPRSFSYP